MKNLLTEVSIPLYPREGSLQGIGPLGQPGDETSALGKFSGIISSVIGIITIIAGIWFVFLLITGAFGFMSSGGDKTKLASAKQKLTSGLIGLIVVIGGIFIIELIGSLIGFDILNIGESFKNAVQ
jgi:hypothetical protein